MSEDMIGDAQSLVAALRQRNVMGLEVAFQLFPDENHISVIPAAFSRGLGVVQALR
jgi:predicted alpha/beta superfamily hydrolase